MLESYLNLWDADIFVRTAVNKLELLLLMNAQLENDSIHLPLIHPKWPHFNPHLSSSATKQ